jgi:hypothetical protein
MKKALEDEKYELIKAHVLAPDDSPLSREHQDQLDRIMSIAKLLDRQPIQKNAVAIHMQKYRDISRSQAYEDCKMAMRLCNTIHSFDYDFWHHWLIEDIIKNIKRCENKNDHHYRRVIALEHANLLKAIGERPEQKIDPKLVEQNNFIIQVQINNELFNIDANKLHNLPESLKKVVTDALITSIGEDEAKEIMES